MGDSKDSLSSHTASDFATSSHDTLHFQIGSEPPEQDLNVYATLRTEFLGEPFSFHIIGESHYIHSEAYGYHELSSCDDPETETEPDVYSIPLVNSLQSELQAHLESLSSRTVIKGHALNKFNRTADYDLVYEFSKDAYTAIDISDTHYETWHTYPEIDLALYTKTEFEESA